MIIDYGKTLSKEDVIQINKIACECGVMFDTARLLYYRNVDSVDKAKKFLNPSLNNLHSPYDFFQMKYVLERLNRAKENSESVLIYGDYDADGICATTVLYNCLKEYGITPRFTVPEREQGYGLDYEKILSLHKEKNIDLIITVDCGISESENVEKLSNNGIDVIVTDHHEPPEQLPQCLIINPKIKNETYLFDGLCGAGVAYKLGYALIGEKANKYLDFVAVATVADNMPLIDENRDIVWAGLKLFAPNKIRSVFKYLITESDKKVTAQTLAYQIAPRVNAGGRMGDALSSLKLFTCENEQEIFDLAVKLNNYNMMRQTESERVYRQAKDLIRKNKLSELPIICVYGEDWSSGVSGIVSAKLVEDYNRPVIVFAPQEDNLKGSARSIDCINIHMLISSVEQYLLSFGGHSQAAGVAVKRENFDNFYKAIVNKMQEEYSNAKLEKSILSDWEIDKPISFEFASEINLLEPFGVGNRKPLFSTKVNAIKASPLKSGSPHYTFETKAITMLNFNGESDVEVLSLPIDKTVLFEINLSSFKGRESIKGFVRKIVPEYRDFSNVRLHVIRNELLKLSNSGFVQEPLGYHADLIKKGYGVLYVINDIQNLSKYNNSDNLSISLFYPESHSGENCIVVSPRTIPEEYGKVVYLDKPMAPINSQVKTFVVDIPVDNFNYNSLKTDRESFAFVYNFLTNLCGQVYLNSADLVYNRKDITEDTLFIFATEVFFELGFFSVENGYLKKNPNVKNALTNSKLYSKILNIKGE